MTALLAVLALAVPPPHVVVPRYQSVAPAALAGAIVEGWSVDADLAATVAAGAIVGGFLGGVHPAWLVAVAAGETGDTFSTSTTGDRGRSLGLCQIQVRTSRASLPWVTRELLLDPWWNLVAAGLHYGRLIDLYGRAKAHVIYGCGFRCRGVTSTQGGRAKMQRYRRILTMMTTTRGET